MGRAGRLGRHAGRDSLHLGLHRAAGRVPGLGLFGAHAGQQLPDARVELGQDLLARPRRRGHRDHANRVARARPGVGSARLRRGRRQAVGRRRVRGAGRFRAAQAAAAREHARALHERAGLCWSSPILAASTTPARRRSSTSTASSATQSARARCCAPDASHRRGGVDLVRRGAHHRPAGVATLNEWGRRRPDRRAPDRFGAPCCTPASTCCPRRWPGASSRSSWSSRRCSSSYRPERPSASPQRSLRAHDEYRAMLGHRRGAYAGAAQDEARRGRAAGAGRGRVRRMPRAVGRARRGWVTCRRQPRRRWSAGWPTGSPSRRCSGTRWGCRSRTRRSSRARRTRSATAWPASSSENFLTREIVGERVAAAHVPQRVGRVAGRSRARRAGSPDELGGAVGGMANCCATTSCAMPWPHSPTSGCASSTPRRCSRGCSTRSCEGGRHQEVCPRGCAA